MKKALSIAAAFVFVAAGASALTQQPIYKPGDSGIKAPEVIFEKKPSYTPEAMRAKIQGTVEMTAVIDEAGKPGDIKVTRPLGMGLDEKAVDTLSQWRFKPATKDAKPVRYLVTVEMTFTLRDRRVYDKTNTEVKAPVLVADKKPAYTPEAMRAHIEGDVEVEGIVDADGTISQVRVVKGLDPGLDANAVRAFKATTFKPALLGTLAVPYRVTMQFTFHLRN